MADVTKMTPLEAAVYEEQTKVGQAVDLLRDIADDAEEDEIDDGQYDALDQIATDLRMTFALLGCLRRFAREATATEAHKVFGAPGDFGYETPVGDALAKLYDSARRGGGR